MLINKEEIRVSSYGFQSSRTRLAQESTFKHGLPVILIVR